MKTMTVSIMMASLVLAAAGCSKEPLVPLDTALASVLAYGSVEAHFCTDAPSPAKQYLKYLFILDHSASNKPGFPNSLTPNDVTNTDPAGARRYGPLVNFVNNLTPDPNNITSFALIDFNDTARQVGTNTGFETDVPTFISLVSKDWIGGGTANAPSPYDSGFTNYQAALQLAYQMILDDAQGVAAANAAPIVATSYQIIFVTDGVPTIATPSGTNPTYTQAFSTDIQPVISNILNLKSNPTLSPVIANIAVSTAYYYNTTEMVSAEQLLQQMSGAGNGQYIQFGSGQNILYQQFVPPSRNIVNQLADVFVENENGVWWDDGRFMADSDGDGLPDLIEKQFGSDPYKRDSDGNGVSDLVEYRTKGKPCNGVNCAIAQRDPYAMCAGYSPVTAADGSVTFASSTSDGLNDCEKFLMGGQVANFSSNGNLIPDFLAILNALPIIRGSANAAFADPFGDGMTNYSKLKLGYPIQVTNKNMSFTPRATSLTVESQPSPQVTCYQLRVDHIALSAAAQNIMKVMVVENSATVTDKPILHVSERALDQNLKVVFQPADFK